MKQKIRNSFLYRTLKRFLTWFGDIMVATKPPRVKAKHIRDMENKIAAGDILLRGYSYYLDSYFIKGEYTHSGLYIGGNTVIHAVAEGVVKIDSIDFIKDCDEFMILRPSYASASHKEKAINFAVKQLGKPYDFLFDKGEKDYFYCHELSYNCLKEAGIEIIPEEKIVYAKDLKKCGSILYFLSD